MNILVTNDDGVSAPGIIRLAEYAKNFGKVTVVAPKEQCSAMSQKITIFKDTQVKKVSFPVDGVDAYCVDGTPADCVKIAVQVIMKDRPDITFSGINNGFNIGYDTAYSGTIGAALESLQSGIPAIAFSRPFDGITDVEEKNIIPIIKELLSTPINRNELFNVNIPGCSLSDFNGILRDRKVAQTMYYTDSYQMHTDASGSVFVKPLSIPVDREHAGEGTDIAAIYDNYISIGKIRNSIMQL